MNKVISNPKTIRINFDNRSRLVKVTLRPTATANYARFATDQAEPLAQLMEDLHHQCEIYQRLQMVIYDLCENPHQAVDTILLKYFPDKKVNWRAHRSYGKLWQNEYITIIEETK